MALKNPRVRFAIALLGGVLTFATVALVVLGVIYNPVLLLVVVVSTSVIGITAKWLWDRMAEYGGDE